MYHVYHTRGIVLARRESGEADCVLRILTPELGMVYATAHGLRRHVSKLRYALQLHSKSTISLVYGKAGWRIVGAVFGQSYWPRRDDGTRAAAVKIATLTARLVQGEDPDHNLFDEVDAALSALCSLENVENADMHAQNIEIVCMARVLNILGYWGEQEDIPQDPFAESDTDSFGLAANKKSRLASEINRALQETQL